MLTQFSLVLGDSDFSKGLSQDTSMGNMLLTVFSLVPKKINNNKYIQRNNFFYHLLQINYTGLIPLQSNRFIFIILFGI